MEATFKADQDALLNRLAAGSEAKTFKLQNGTEYLVWNGQILGQAEPRTRFAMDRISVESLESFAALVQKCSNREDFLVQVIRPNCVVLSDVAEPEKHQTVAQASATLPTLHLLNEFVLLESALMSLREGFQPGVGVESLSEQLSSVRIEDLTELRDDGVSMAVGTKTRIVSEGKKETATVFSLELSPIRTFSEVEIVPSLFTMRWKRNGNNVLVRLIEQEHNAWRLAQMNAVAAHLKELLPDATILV